VGESHHLIFHAPDRDMLDSDRRYAGGFGIGIDGIGMTVMTILIESTPSTPNSAVALDFLFGARNDLSSGLSLDVS
jgi:hypothetical protein